MTAARPGRTRAGETVKNDSESLTFVSLCLCGESLHSNFFRQHAGLPD